MRTKFWSENLKGRAHTEDLGVDGRIIVMASCKHGNEPSDSIKGGEFLTS
jgi:hypothetical protein